MPKFVSMPPPMDDLGGGMPMEHKPDPGYYPPAPGRLFTPQQHVGGMRTPDRDHKGPHERNKFGGPKCSCPQCKSINNLPHMRGE